MDNKKKPVYEARIVIVKSDLAKLGDDDDTRFEEVITPEEEIVAYDENGYQIIEHALALGSYFETKEEVISHIKHLEKIAFDISKNVRVHGKKHYIGNNK